MPAASGPASSAERARVAASHWPSGDHESSPQPGTGKSLEPAVRPSEGRDEVDRPRAARVAGSRRRPDEGNLPAVRGPARDPIRRRIRGEPVDLRGPDHLDVDVVVVRRLPSAHLNATCSPSGENVGSHSQPLSVVSGTSCGGGRPGARVRRTSQVAADSTRIAARATPTRQPTPPARAWSGPRELLRVRVLLDLLELELHVGHALVAPVGLLPQASQDDPLQVPRHVRGHLARGLRLLPHHRRQRGRRRVPREGPAPRHHLVEQRPEAEDVGPGVHVPAAGLLGGHVSHRPRDRPGAT